MSELSRVFAGEVKNERGFAQHLAHMMLVQALRLHLAEGSKGGVGWVFALADEQMSAAINAMHEDPVHR
jgi:hypothetical protein